MSLKYALLENFLTTRADDYTAQIQEVKSHDLKSVVSKMKKGSTSDTNAIAIITSFFEAIEEITGEGESISTDLIHTKFSIQGVFNGANDTFDPKRHTLRLNVTASKNFKKALSNITLEKTTAPDVSVQLLEVKDSVSGSINQNITSEGVVEIVGNMLKIDGSDPSNGIFFVASDGTVNKVVTIIENKPSRLIAIIPTLKAGTYTLRVTTQYNGGTPLNAPRSGTFHLPLTVS